MPSPSLTYTLTNGTTADADQVMQNFNDLLNGITDGTKDISVSALTAAGTATLNGSVNLGNASADDITVTGSLASSIPIKTSNTYNIGSSTLGLASIYLGANSQTVRLLGSGSMSATWSMTLPVSAGTAGFGLQTNGSGVTSWQPMQTDTHSVSSADYTVLDTDGYATILVTTGSSDRTITLPTAADNVDRRITIIKVDSGTGGVIIDGENAETVNGETSITLALQWISTTLVCDGTSWYSRTGYFNSFRSTTSPSSGAGTSPTDPIIHIVRNGPLVQIFAKVTTGTGSPGSSITWTALAPTWARPAAATKAEAYQISTGSEIIDQLRVNTSGDVVIERAVVNTSLVATSFGTSSLQAGRCSYLIGE